MFQPNSLEEKYEFARIRVSEMKNFYSNLVVYVFINAILMAENFLLTPDHLWFYWPMLIWGALIAAQALSVFAASNLFSRDWEERKIRELLVKEHAKISDM